MSQSIPTLPFLHLLHRWHPRYLLFPWLLSYELVQRRVHNSSYSNLLCQVLVARLPLWLCQIYRMCLKNIMTLPMYSVIPSLRNFLSIALTISKSTLRKVLHLCLVLSTPSQNLNSKLFMNLLMIMFATVSFLLHTPHGAPVLFIKKKTGEL